MIPTIENVVFKYTGWPANLGKAAMNAILKQAFKEIGEHWHAKFLPIHFTVAGAKKYGYTPRKGEGKSGKAFWRSYTGQKKKYKGHMRPLVFSGKGRQEATMLVKVRATSKGCRVALPRKFNFKNPNSEVNMREEITAVTADEHAKLMKVFERSIVRQLNADRDAKLVTVKG